MLIEMLFLGYAARLVYVDRPASKDTEGGFTGVPAPKNNSPGNGEDATNNNDETRTGPASGQQLPLSVQHAGVTA